MTISRRGFLGGAGLGAVAAASGTASAAGGKHFKGHPGSYGLLHDTTLCVGCRSCEVACAEVNDLPAPAPVDTEEVFDEARRTTATELTVVNRYQVPEADGKEAGDAASVVYRKQQCMHCNEPCCVAVCLVGAFEKTPEGPVLYHEDLCMGCRYCVMACPYYALSYEYDNPLTPEVMRCTMCRDRILEGKLPGCAEACPNGAITFGRREDLIKLARNRIAKTPDRYLDHIFGEHEYGGTSWLVLAGTDFANIGLPEDLPPTPLPEIGTAYLGVVPLIITIYPGLLGGIYAFTKRKDKLAKEERDQAVAEARAAAEEQTRDKLTEANKRAKRDQERAVETAVKKALAEAAKEQGGAS
ncbi:MAG: 4Fe-4S dicluster domain-containing protein [Deltaproteobacteria bacterium]|nr:4Fe-4S dicluster domain-containing protein [Deltaproteobacteria bacterium]